MRGKKDFLILFFLLGMFLFRLNVFSIVHEIGHLTACWLTGSPAVLKNWITTETRFLTPFSLYAGFVFQAIVLYILSLLFVRKDISCRWGFLFWGAFHGALIVGYNSSDFNTIALQILGHPGLVALGKNLWLAVMLPAAGLGWYILLRSMIYNQNKGFGRFMERVRKRLGLPMKE